MKGGQYNIDAKFCIINLETNKILHNQIIESNLSIKITNDLFNENLQNFTKTINKKINNPYFILFNNSQYIIALIIKQEYYEKFYVLNRALTIDKEIYIFEIYDFLSNKFKILKIYSKLEPDIESKILLNRGNLSLEINTIMPKIYEYGTLSDYIYGFNNIFFNLENKINRHSDYRKDKFLSYSNNWTNYSYNYFIMEKIDIIFTSENNILYKNIQSYYILKKIIDAIKILIKYNIIHTDIKLENIGIAYCNNKITPKIIDYNLSNFLILENDYKLNHKITTYNVTSPELLLTGITNESLKYVDIFSLGTLIIKALTNEYLDYFEFYKKLEEYYLNFNAIYEILKLPHNFITMYEKLILDHSSFKAFNAIIMSHISLLLTVYFYGNGFNKFSENTDELIGYVSAIELRNFYDNPITEFISPLSNNINNTHKKISNKIKNYSIILMGDESNDIFLDVNILNLLATKGKQVYDEIFNFMQQYVNYAKNVNFKFDIDKLVKCLLLPYERTKDIENILINI